MVKVMILILNFFLSERTRTLLYQSSSFIVRCQIWETASERRGDVTLYMTRKRPVSDSTAAGCEHSCSSSAGLWCCGWMLLGIWLSLWECCAWVRLVFRLQPLLRCCGNVLLLPFERPVIRVFPKDQSSPKRARTTAAWNRCWTH